MALTPSSAPSFGDPDDMTELYDAQVPRVDLVGKAANGVPGFLLMKQDGTGLIDPDTVRELIAKATPTPVDVVTLTGSPAAVAELIKAHATDPTHGKAAPMARYQYRYDRMGVTVLADRSLTNDEVVKASRGQKVPGVVFADFMNTVAKAKASTTVPVFDENGKLIGTVDRKDIQQFAAAEPLDPAPAAPAAPTSVAPAAAAPAAPAPPAAPAAAQPAATVAKMLAGNSPTRGDWQFALTSAAQTINKAVGPSLSFGAALTLAKSAGDELLRSHPDAEPNALAALAESLGEYVAAQRSR